MCKYCCIFDKNQFELWFYLVAVCVCISLFKRTVKWNKWFVYIRCKKKSIMMKILWNDSQTWAWFIVAQSTRYMRLHTKLKICLITNTFLVISVYINQFRIRCYSLIIMSIHFLFFEYLHRAFNVETYKLKKRTN